MMQRSPAGLISAAICALALWLTLVPWHANAEEPPPAPADNAPQPEEITSADFAIQASAVEERISRIEAEIAAIDVADEVNAALDGIEADGIELEAYIKQTLTRRAMSTELNTMRLALETLQARVKRQIDKLGVYAGELEGLADQNKQDLELWSRALRSIQRLGAPDEVKKRTASIVKGLRDGGRALETKLDGQLVLQSRALEVRDSIDLYLREITTAQRDQAEAVFERQDPPLWKIGAEEPKADERVGYGLSLSSSALVNGLRRDGGLVLFELLLVVFLAWMLSWSRRDLNDRLERRKDAGELQWEKEAMEALRHPWAAAALLTLASVRLVYPDREVELILLTWILVVPLWFIVFKEMAPPEFRRVLIGLGFLATLHIIATLVADHPTLERIFLLIQLLLFFIGAWWFVRSLHVADHERKRKRRGFWLAVADVWARLTWIVAGVGVIAVVLGYTFFATDAALLTTIATIAATAWMAVSRIVEAVLSTAIHDGRLDAFRMVRANRDVVSKVARRLTRLTAFGLFAWSIADVTTVWRPLGRRLVGFLSADLGFGFATLDLTVADLLGFFFVLWLSWFIARFVSFVLREEIFPRLSMKQGLPYALTAFTRYAIIAIGFVAAISILGVSLDRLTIVLSALGVGIGFGLQSIVNNVVSGFILLTERPVRLRDKVEVDNILGIVSGIGIRASSIRTFDGAEVILPNSDLTSKRLINWTLSERQQRITIPVGVEYGTDPNRVLDLLRSVAASHEKVFSHPAPLALFRGFGDSSLDFELRIFMDPSDVLDVPSEVAVRIDEALKQAGIVIPFPQRDLHVRDLPETLKKPASRADDPDDSGE